MRHADLRLVETGVRARSVAEPPVTIQRFSTAAQRARPHDLAAVPLLDHEVDVRELEALGARDRALLLDESAEAGLVPVERSPGRPARGGERLVDALHRLRRNRLRPPFLASRSRVRWARSGGASCETVSIIQSVSAAVGSAVWKRGKSSALSASNARRARPAVVAADDACSSTPSPQPASEARPGERPGERPGSVPWGPPLEEARTLPAADRSATPAGRPHATETSSVFRTTRDPGPGSSAGPRGTPGRRRCRGGSRRDRDRCRGSPRRRSASPRRGRRSSRRGRRRRR